MLVGFANQPSGLLAELSWWCTLLLIAVVINVFYCITGSRCPSDFIAHPILTPQDAGLATAITEATVADICRIQQSFIDCCRQLETAQTEWVSFSE